MSTDAEPTAVVGLRADPELTSHLELVPSAVGRPPAARVFEGRDRMVGTGAALTGIALVGGGLLTLAALIDLIAQGGLVPVIGLILGIVLVGTHWGWVHVAESRADAQQHRLDLNTEGEQAAWLASIAPFTHEEVATRAEPDGAVTIERIRYRPVPSTEATFTFEREVTAIERHDNDEPGEVVAERAEMLRHEAARATEWARAVYEAELDVRERRELAAADDQERDRVRSAEANALSEQLNARLRDPPLSE